MIKLDILSDPICPWCYIGKANLDRALELHPEHPFEIEWHPFQLNPDMPANGMDRREYLETKFGGRDGAIKAYAPIDQAAKEAGLEINWAGIKRTSNTFNAHRLIHWAGIEGRQTSVVSGIFRAFFKEGLDIGDVDVLYDIAQIAGLDRTAIQALMDTDADADDLRTREGHSRKMGVASVPTFIVANQVVVTGAQKPELWADVIADFLKEQGGN